MLLTFRLFYKLKILFLIAIAITVAIPIKGFPENQSSKIPIGDFRVRVLKRNTNHIQTAALLCALQENKAKKKLIKEAWYEKLQDPISADDEFLVISIMGGMCPEIKPQKPGSY